MKIVLIKILFFVSLSTLLCLPLFMEHTKVMQTILASADIRIHINAIFDSSYNYVYYGQWILKVLSYPFINRENSIKLYLILNFVALIGVIISTYFVIKKLINEEAAFISIPILLFVNSSVLALFKYGVIFNIINMNVILPWTILFFIKWTEDKKWRNAIATIILLFLFSIVHYTGLYLLFIIPTIIVLHSALKIIKHEKIIDIKKKIPTKMIIAFILFSMFIGILLLKERLQLFTIHGISINPLLLMFNHMTIPSIALTLISIVSIIKYRKDIKEYIKRNSKSKYFVLILVSTAIPLLFGLMLTATEDYNRLAIDLVSIISILMATVLGIFWKIKFNLVMKWSIMGLIVLSSATGIVSWVS